MSSCYYKYNTVKIKSALLKKSINNVKNMICLLVSLGKNMFETHANYQGFL